MADETADELEPGQRHTSSGPLSMVVGIGASAGGIKALSEFFAQVPARTPIAYVVILSPDHESNLAELLQATTSLPVTWVREPVALEPAHVYVIQSNQSLEVKDSTLQLVPTARQEERREEDIGTIAGDLTSQRQAASNLQHAHDHLEERVKARTGELQAEVVRRAGAQQHITRLLHRIVTAQEDERSRIARDLHDQLGQQLTALRLAIERHCESQHGGQSDEELERALTLARQIDSQVDFLAWELRPAVLDDLGVAAALPRYLSEWSAHHGIATDFQKIGSLPAGLGPQAETTLYRVTQEALTNVLKHAHASRVDVVLEGLRDAVTLVIEDDGVGFDPAAVEKGCVGIGLVGMRERAALINATLQVESTPGKGTTIFLRCPLGEPSGG